MATIRLEISAAGVRPFGFFSRDRADEAVSEARALLAALSPDGAPTRLAWRRQGDDLAPERAPLFTEERPSLWEYDAANSSLRTDWGGGELTAEGRGRSFDLFWRGQPLRPDGDGWVSTDGERFGGASRLVVDSPRWARISGGQIGVQGLRWSGGGSLPSGTVIRARWRTEGQIVDLGGVAPVAGGCAWPAPSGWEQAVERGATIELTSNLVLDEPLNVKIPAVARTDFSGLRAQRADVALDWVRVGDVIAFVQFQTKLTAPPARLVVSVAATRSDWRATWRLESAGVAAGVAVYRLDSPEILPVSLRSPDRLVFTANGQDEPLGALLVAPARVAARWRMSRDPRGSATWPAWTDAHLELVEGGGTRLADAGSAVLDVEGTRVTLPVSDQSYVPALARDPRVPVGSGEAQFPGLQGAGIVWTPGYPPVDVSFDADGRLRPRSAALAEMLFEWRRRERIVRIQCSDRRGVVGDGVPKDAIEVPSWGGTLPLRGEDAVWLWFRGLTFAAGVVQVGEGAQRMLALQRPIPCDGRLGLDVGSFLPARVRPSGASLHVEVAGRGVSLAARDGRVAATGHPGAVVQWESRWGFHEGAPAEPTGRFAVFGAVMGSDGAGWTFAGWLLDPTFEAPADGPWGGYRLLPGGPESRDLRVGSGFPRPSLPEDVLRAADAALHDGVRAPLVARSTGGGSFRLTPVFHDPRGAAAFIEVEPESPPPTAQVRLYRLPKGPA